MTLADSFTANVQLKRIPRQGREQEFVILSRADKASPARTECVATGFQAILERRPANDC